MTTNYYLQGKVILSMVDYIGKMINETTEYIRGKSSTQAVHHPFDIEKYATKLSQTDADIFHHFVV